MTPNLKKLTLGLLFFLMWPLTGAAQQMSQQDQLDQLAARVQQSPADQSLREQVIRFAASMLPAPAVPEDARRYYIEGLTLHQDAKSAADEGQAIASYQKGLAVAPWWGDLYLALAVSQESSGNLQGAVDALHDYLLSAPPPDKARTAQDHMYMLDAKLKEQTATQQTAEDVVTGRKKLSGLWKCKTNCQQPYMRVDSDGHDFHVKVGDWSFDGHFEGNAVTGLVTYPGGNSAGASGCTFPPESHQMTAYVEDNGTTIRLQYQMNIYAFRWHKAPDPILGWLSAHTLCDGETVSATNAQQTELTGGPKKPLLGIEVRTITPEVAAAYTAGWWTPVIKQGFRACNRARKTNTAGAIVASVAPNSPAAAAGLKTGDIINVQKGGGLFCSAEELVKYIDNIVPDYPYTLEVYFGSNKPWLYTLKNAAVNAY